MPSLPRRFHVWILVRLAEVLLCILVLQINLGLGLNDFIDVARGAIWIATIYGLYFLYWPISALLWWMTGEDRVRSRFADSGFLVCHCYFSMTMIFGGPPGITIPWDFSPAIAIWLTLCVLHAALVMTAVTVRQRDIG
jgi:hypothetical protein